MDHGWPDFMLSNMILDTTSMYKITSGHDTGDISKLETLKIISLKVLGLRLGGLQNQWIWVPHMCTAPIPSFHSWASNASKKTIYGWGFVFPRWNRPGGESTGYDFCPVSKLGCWRLAFQFVSSKITPERLRLEWKEHGLELISLNGSLKQKWACNKKVPQIDACFSDWNFGLIAMFQGSRDLWLLRR